MNYVKRSRRGHNRPEAFLTIHRNRLKVYQGRNVYMEDGNEFSVELDNRTNKTWLAKIKLNGEWTDESGLILRPGEHFYLDTPNLTGGNKRKFKFETYNIPKGRGDLVQDNGLVEVFFYPKTEPIQFSYTYSGTWWNNDNGLYGQGRFGYYDDTGKTPRGPEHIYCSNVGAFNDTDGSSITLTSNNSDAQLSLDQPKNTEETGRVELGSKSHQQFKEVAMDFGAFHDFYTEYHILPMSKKHTRPHEVKNYCSDCGRRRRKNDRFCPNCGTKF